MITFGKTSAGWRDISKYLTWKGKDGYFEYYDKEAGENKKFDFTEAVILNAGYTIKGWHDWDQSGIYSNEVIDFNDEMFVRTFKWTRIAKWKYSDIKWDLQGWRIHIWITVLHEGEVIEFFLKWIAYFQFNEFIKELDHNSKKLKYEWSKEDKKWSVKFKVPIWSEWSDITDKEKEQASSKVESLLEYYKKKPELDAEDAEEIFSDEEITIESIL